MIELDGSYGEGGGALVRTALALSALTGRSFSVQNIRSGRPNPGLKAQHLAAINALKDICDAKTNEVSIGSTSLRFIPNAVKRGIYEIDIGTAGSVSLVLQAVLLPCLFAPGKVTLHIRGGTCGKWQAGVDYIQNVLFPYVRRFVEKLELKVVKRGYFPKGGGEVHVVIHPKYSSKEKEAFLEEMQYKIPVFMLDEQGTLEQVRGIVNVSSELQEKDVADRIKRNVELYLKPHAVPVSVRTEYASSLSVGGEVVIWAICSKEGNVNFDTPIMIGSDALVEKGKSSGDVAKEVVERLNMEIKAEAAVDSHLADMLIPFIALRPGSKIKTSIITDHTKTNMYVVEQFLQVGFTEKDSTISVEKI